MTGKGEGRIPHRNYRNVKKGGANKPPGRDVGGLKKSEGRARSIMVPASGRARAERNSALKRGRRTTINHSP